MDVIKIKEDFVNQLQKTKEKIAELEDELDKAKEYKFKLIGGLETLELLEDKQDLNEINTIST
jgi:hypothetical protein